MSTPGDFADTAQGVAAAIGASAVNPADALRLLASLATFQSAEAPTASPIGLAMGVVQSATNDLFRRAAVVALARASSTYQPESFEDAAAVSAMVCGLLDQEITLAGDQGEDASYIALTAVRTAVFQDLADRGASLPTVTTIRSPLPMPAPVLAQRVYRDPSRADELIAHADVKHPAFMPQNFTALSR